MSAKILRRIFLISSAFGAAVLLYIFAPRATAQTQGSMTSDAASPQLDYEYFKTRVEPIFLKKRSDEHARCYVCHQMMRHGGGPLSLEMLPPGASFWTDEQSHKNFETVSKLVVPGNTTLSLFLQMPLAPEAGGLADTHQGGRQFADQNDPDWLIMKAWVMGEKAGSAAPQQAASGQWVDPANPSDELVDGPYRIDPTWPKPIATSYPEEKGWTWGAVQGIFAQNPDRIFVAMRGELPDLANAKKKFVEIETAYGITTHLEVPGRGMYGRNASVGDYASPGEATDTYKGVEGQDYRWKHIITVYDSEGNVKEAWTQWDSLFKPDNPNVLSQGRVHKILISPYDPEKRVWAIDDGHEVIRIFSNDGKKLLQTIGTLNTTTARNAKMTGNTGRPSYIQKTGPDNETFGRQTDIAWLPDGTFFVTDGYEETRVVKFDKDGKFLVAWGERGEVNGKEKRPGYFNTVHGIAIDNQRRIYVNDRSNRRIQIFDEYGKFLDQWYLGDGPTATYHIYMTADQHLWMSDGHGNFKFYKYDLNGRLLYTWGTMTPEAGGLWGTHQFGVDQDGNLYTAEVWGGRPQKFVPRKGADPALLVGQPVRAAWTR